MGAESFSAIKKNQKDYDEYAEKLLKDRSVDLVGELERGHGRWEIRDLTVVAVDTEVSPFPHIATILKSRRIYRPTEKEAAPKIAVRLFGISMGYEERTVAQFSQIVR